ncbi:hypothetical protein C8R42DRAFT_650643 [Lentinula raphanica]|nr:hypothetical protein C8R42DRAFT_650643 [Lentinula raphanica]
MSLQYYSNADQRQLEEDDGRYKYSSRIAQIFDDNIRYLQKTLLGFDSDASFYHHLVPSSLDLLPWWKGHGQLVENKPESPHRKAGERVSIEHLPVEIMQEIFSYFMPDRHWRIYRAPPPQLILLQVSTRWRSIALSYTRLWSTFMIHYPIHEHIRMTKLWLEHSGQHPLTIYIYDPRDDSKSTTTRNDMINLLLPHAHRWKTAIFVIPTGFKSLLSALPSLQFPLLETLCIDVVHYKRVVDRDDVEQMKEVFFHSSAPCLRAITWKTYRTYLHITRSIPTSTLTHLAGSFVIDSTFFEMLSTMNNLETLCLHYCRSDSLNRPRLAAPVVLHRLHSLDLRLEPELLFLLDLMRAPDLAVLLIGQPYSQQGRKMLCAFLQKSGCSLKALTYLATFYHRLDNTFWDELLLSPAFRSVTELNILGDDGDFDTVLWILAQTDGDHFVLPFLNRLWIQCAHGRCSSDCLSDMLECRATAFHPPVSPLLSEQLLDRDYQTSGGYIPASQYSLRFYFGRYDPIDGIAYWLGESYDKPHWKMFETWER